MGKFAFHFLLGIPSVQTADQEPATTDLNSNYIEYKVDKPTFACNLEYTLAPGEQPKSVDIICWGNVAKIYMEDDNVALIPLGFEKICWIYFRVKHKHVNTINNETVNDYYKHNIVVTASFDRKKSENAKAFYGRPSACGSHTHLFPRLWDRPEDMLQVPVKQLDSNIEKCKFSCKLQTIICEMTKEMNNEAAARKPTPLQKENPPWKTVCEENPQTVSDGKSREPPIPINPVPSNPAPTKPAPNKPKNKKEGPKKEIEPPKPKQTLSFVISGEEVLSGKKVFENCVKYRSEELPIFCCVTEVSNVLDRDQAKHLNPFSVTLNWIKFLPMSVLEDHNIRRVRFRYVIFDGYEAESNDFEIDEKLLLNYTRTIFTDRISVPELVEFIQTKGLKISVIGIKDDTAEVRVPELFKDQRINSKSSFPGMKMRRPGTPHDAVIGTAYIDISPLIFEPRELTVDYNFGCHKQNLSKLVVAGLKTTINPTEVNNSYKTVQDTWCRILSSSEAVLSVSVRQCFPVMETFECMRPVFGTRNRLFLILDDLPLTVNIIKWIQLKTAMLSPTDYARSAARIYRPPSPYNNVENEEGLAMMMLTGFLIDCVTNYLIYIEGPSLGVIQEIWPITSFVDPSRGRVLYDSSLVFNDLYHEELIRYGGFYVVTLQQSPMALLSDKNLYRKGNIPMAAYKALTKIYQLLQCTSIRTAIRNDLFPDYHSLLSLDLEFGVPLRFRPAPNRHR